MMHRPQQPALSSMGLPGSEDGELAIPQAKKCNKKTKNKKAIR